MNIVLSSGLKTKEIEACGETFLDYLDVDDLTLKTYKVGIYSFLKYLNENKISIPTRDDIIGFRNMIRENYSSNTVNTYMVGVKALFKFLKIKGVCEDLSQDIKGAKFDTTPRKEILSLEQIRNIYNSLSDLREKALFSLMIGTGCRVCEIQTACIEDIKEYNGEIVFSYPSFSPVII